MNEIIIGAIILVILISVFMSIRQRLAGAESDRTAKRAERESWGRESVVSYGQVQRLREDLIKSMEEKLADQPEHVEQLKEIINEWAELKMQSFRERRSWVRKPDQTKQEQ